MSSLPRSADEHLRKLKLDPELEELARRIFPDDKRDAEARARAEAERTAKAQQEQRNRDELVQKCLDGGFGKDAQGAAKLALDEAGGVRTTMVQHTILRLIREAQWQEKQAKARR